MQSALKRQQLSVVLFFGGIILLILVQVLRLFDILSDETINIISVCTLVIPFGLVFIMTFGSVKTTTLISKRQNE